METNLTDQNRFPPETINELINMTDMVFKQNYYKFNDTFYIQNDGLPMGSPLSGLIAGTFFNSIAHKYILTETNHHKPSIIYYYKYVDDMMFKQRKRETNQPFFKCSK